MASEIIIQIECDPHLIKFFETFFKSSPVVFPRQSNFNNILDVFVDIPPLGYIEPVYPFETLKIELPFFENKDIRSYYYLSEWKRNSFVREINKFFKITYRSEISNFVHLGLDRKDAITLFLEKYNISENSRDLLEKDFQRYLKIRSYRRLLRKNKNSSDKRPVCPSAGHD
jgi:hypothetical protein